MSDLISVMVAKSTLYAQGKAKSFKAQADLIAAHQQGFKDYKDRSDRLIMEFLKALMDFEKAKIDFKHLPGAIKIKESAFERIVLIVKEELETVL